MEWISVKDRLPPENEALIVCINGQVTTAWREGEDWTAWFLVMGFIKSYAPTHWQPLPLPPKETA